ncbi:MAG: SDR family oxidoreductase [Candidatus Helarchaeota archaeon]|nr:SDR family oxidoreductase [Candidatus Helarchaeota archaeon]
MSKKVLLLTAASGGIGNTLMEYFVDKVQYMITSNRKKLTEFLTLKPIPPNIEHVPRDLTIEDNVRSLFQHITDNYGKLDILINCVGASLFSHPIEDFPVNEFEKIIALNLKSAFLLTKHAIKAMKTHGGNIVHYVSSSAKNISPNKAPYGSAKAGLAHFIHYAAYETANYNIKVNGISPTYVFTPRHEKEIQTKIVKTGKKREEIVNKILSHQLLQKPMYSKDLIEVTELLATTESITGQIYNCSMGEILSY